MDIEQFKLAVKQAFEAYEMGIGGIAALRKKILIDLAQLEEVKN